MRQYYFFLIPFLFFFSCSNSELEEETVISHKISKQDEAKKDTISETKTDEVKLFEMNPEPDFDLYENINRKSSDVKYFEGTIGESDITMMLIEASGSGPWKGKYIYNTNGHLFDVSTNFNPVNDTILFTREKEGEKVESFLTRYNTESQSYEGIWVKKNDTLPVQLKLKKASAVERQLFIQLSGKPLYNTPSELVYNRDEASISGISFNDFSSLGSWGDGYDFGQEWEEEKEMVFFKNEMIRYVKVNCINSEGTDFVEGKEPSDQNDDSYEIKGSTYSSQNTIAYKTIKDGIVEEKEIVFNVDKNAESWIIGDYIIFLLTMNEEANNFKKYKWDSSIQEYKEIK